MREPYPFGTRNRRRTPGSEFRGLAGLEAPTGREARRWQPACRGRRSAPRPVVSLIPYRRRPDRPWVGRPSASSRPGWTAIVLARTVVASVTGFRLPAERRCRLPPSASSRWGPSRWRCWGVTGIDSRDPGAGSTWEARCCPSPGTGSSRWSGHSQHSRSCQFASPRTNTVGAAVPGRPAARARDLRSGGLKGNVPIPTGGPETRLVVDARSGQGAMWPRRLSVGASREAVG